MADPHTVPSSSPPFDQGDYRVFLDLAPDAMVIVDTDGSIVAVNRQTELMFGYQEAELLGKSVDSFVPPRLRSKHPTHRANYLAIPHARPMGTGLELFGLRKDGTEFPVEISLSPVRHSNGTMLIVTAIRDITLRKRDEDKFRALLESAPDGMIILDPLGKIAIVNSQTELLFEYQRSELIGHEVECLLPTRYRAEHSGHRQAYAAHPRARPMGAGLELFGLRKNGTEFPVEISLSPLKTEEGTFTIAAVRDISERRVAEAALRKLYGELEDALRRSEKLATAGRLLTSIAHEIKNPLGALSNLLFLLDSDQQLTAEQKKRLTTAHQMVEQINRIVGQTLAPHREVKTAELVNIVELLDDICEMFRAQAQSHRISVSRVGSAATYVKSYPSELRQVFTNLISNAIDAMPQGGQLQLGVSENQNCVTINIEDSGAGIAAEHLHRLFDPFFTTKAEKGTGLGLWITK
jgi:protein-histidine pros-kinase